MKLPFKVALTDGSETGWLVPDALISSGLDAEAFAAAFGNDTKALLRHYHTTGKAEGRDVYCTM